MYINLFFPLLLDITNIIIYSFQANEEPYPDTKKNKNDHPYIIASGEKHNKITRYFIEIENDLIHVILTDIL